MKAGRGEARAQTAQNAVAAAEAEEEMPRLDGPQTNACARWACRIQQCLQDNHFDSKACSWEVNALRECCRKFGTNSTHCAKAWQPQEAGGGEATAAAAGGGSTAATAGAGGAGALPGGEGAAATAGAAKEGS